jgi:hypothetical protein
LVKGGGLRLFDTTLVPQSPTPNDALLNFGFRVEHAEANGKVKGAAALRAWREVHDPFELKDWIEERLTIIWKLDAALNLAEGEGVTDLEGVAAPFLRGLFRYAPKAPQKRKSPRPNLLKPVTKPPTQKPATDTPKAA